MGCARSARMKERSAAAYVVKDKEVKASARASKRRWLNDLTEESETAARNNCTGDLYPLTRKIAGQRNICYSPAGRSVLGKTVPEVSSTARGRRPRDVLETEGTVFPNTDRLRPVNNIFIYF